MFYFSNNRIKVFYLAIILLLLSSMAKAKSNMNIGHYFVDAPTENYQFTSVSVGFKHENYKAKLMVPFIQRTHFSNGLGNPLLKLSKYWQDESKQNQLTAYIKQKIALADEDTTTAVNDTGLGLEYSTVYNWGIPFIEAGYWWRESISYTRKNTFYGSLGIIKPIKTYVVAAFLDNKPTALGGKDSMASVFVRKKVSAKLSISCLYGIGLTKSSPNHTLGLQVNRTF